MSNISIKVTADVIDLQTKMAIAKAESQAFSSELNKLGRQAAQAGTEMTTELKAGLYSAAEASIKAKAGVQSLNVQMNEARASGRHFAETMSLAKETMAAFGVVASVASVVQFGRSVEENAAHLYHQAQVLQISVPAYQALREAARDTGVELETVDTALLRFSKSIAEAQVGVGPAAKDLVEMGISANQSKEALLQQVSAFAMHSDAATRDRIAVEFFSRSGAEMIPVFEKWAEGTDVLTDKYERLGRVMSTETAKAAEEADIKMSAAWAHLQTEAAPAIIKTTTKLAELVEWLNKADAAAHKYGDTWQGLGSLLTGGLITPPSLPTEKPLAKPTAGPHAPTEQEEIAALTSINPKLRERAGLEQEIALAQKAAADARKAGDTKGLSLANETISDLQKQLDGLNKTKFGGGFSDAGVKAMAEARTQVSGIEADPSTSAAEKNTAAQAIYQKLLQDAHLNAAQILQVRDELNRQIASGNRDAAQEADQEARSDTSRDLALAKQGFTEKKAILDQEFAERRITAQEKYQATVNSLNAEAAAERLAQQQVMDSAVTTVVQKHDAANQMVVINAEMNAQIAEAARQLTSDLKTEDEKRYESWRAVTNEIENAEGQLVTSVFSGRQSLSQSLTQLGLRFLQEEITNDLKALTEHKMVNMGILASDKATSQAGILMKLLGIGQEAAADQTAKGAKVASEAAGAAEQGVINVAQVQSAAAVAFANTFASVSAIPVIGPALAPEAAAGAMAAVEAVSPMAALATGTNYVPRDMIAQIHEGEAVVPRAYNPAAGGSNSGTPGTAGPDLTVHQHFNGGFTHRDFIEAAARQPREFQKAVAHLVRVNRLKLA